MYSLLFKFVYVNYFATFTVIFLNLNCQFFSSYSLFKAVLKWRPRPVRSKDLLSPGLFLEVSDQTRAMMRSCFKSSDSEDDVQWYWGELENFFCCFTSRICWKCAALQHRNNISLVHFEYNKWFKTRPA